MLSSFAICTHATCCRRGHILRGDKCLSIVNAILLIATVLATTLLSGQEPWTNGIVEFKRPARGLITYCSTLNQQTDATYPILYQRCILWDGVWLGTIVLCVAWILLGLCATLMKPSKREDAQLHYHWPNPQPQMYYPHHQQYQQQYQHPQLVQALDSTLNQKNTCQNSKDPW
ncbi:hypothetical protein BCV72DRAFT_221305 [Rhizopus microsporus var. microsporus]|uniref:Uncharacterized protein n=2 Tax=Rhizopus microsporus TaxID=58291 RepID=A0A2G4SN92_RHIZD|nr:uncharacterized protein RHIMIDRAFT_260227 [Rhizopus microsporus ATCC 52813]ORE10579.1 hypothetical protein BCV72DRAFT_221305 [Rhizopus microsporus var. microsporus]PHZ10251.1 hypothetical protein RHIMIDRAFT_260227 [Rhizopus microsporus ATCC 52813]